MEETTEMTREDKLKELFAELERDAYNSDYHNYYIKQANQIIRKHFERILPSPSSATAEDFNSLSLPPAEGAEEILYENINELDLHFLYYDKRDLLNEIITSMEKFAAQQVAEATKDVTKQRDELREKYSKLLDATSELLRSMKTDNVELKKSINEIAKNMAAEIAAIKSTERWKKKKQKHKSMLKL